MRKSIASNQKLFNQILSVLIPLVIVTSNMAGPYFYINWALGGLVIIWLFVHGIAQRDINKKVIIAIAISCLWLIIPIINQLFGQLIDRAAQTKRLLIFLFNLSFGGIAVYYLSNLSDNAKQENIEEFGVVWAIISIISFGIFVFANPAYLELVGSRNYAGIFENRNVFAIFTTLLLSYLVHFRRETKSKLRLVFTAITLLMLILLSQSLKGFFGVVFLLVFEGIIAFPQIMSGNKKQSRKRYISMVVFFIIIITVFLLIALTDNPLSQRLDRVMLLFTSPDELSEGESIAQRMFYLNKGLEVIGENPHTGIGFANSRYYLVRPSLLERGINVGTYSHINYLEMMLGGGIITFVLYYLPIVTATITLFRNRKKHKRNMYVFFIGLYVLAIDFAAVTYDMMLFNMLYVLIVFSGLTAKDWQPTNVL